MFKKAICSGIAVGIGFTIFANTSQIIGGFLFCLGLLTVIFFECNLYTGKVGYLMRQPDKLKAIKDLLIIILGNATGMFIYTLMLKQTRYISSPDLVLKLQALTDARLNDDPLSILILSIFCGVIMFMVVDTYKTNENKIVAVIYIFLGIVGFIVAGYEHSIANMFHFFMNDSYTLKTFAYLLIMLIGNGLGSVLAEFMLVNQKIISK